MGTIKSVCRHGKEANDQHFCGIGLKGLRNKRCMEIKEDREVRVMSAQIIRKMLVVNESRQMVVKTLGLQTPHMLVTGLGEIQSVLIRKLLLCWLSCIVLEGAMQAIDGGGGGGSLTVLPNYEPCNNNPHGMNPMSEDQGHMLSQLLSEWISGLLHRREHMPSSANLAGEITSSRSEPNLLLLSC